MKQRLKQFVVTVPFLLLCCMLFTSIVPCKAKAAVTSPEIKFVKINRSLASQDFWLEEKVPLRIHYTDGSLQYLDVIPNKNQEVSCTDSYGNVLTVKLEYTDKDEDDKVDLVFNYGVFDRDDQCMTHIRVVDVDAIMECYGFYLAPPPIEPEDDDDDYDYYSRKPAYEKGIQPKDQEEPKEQVEKEKNQYSKNPVVQPLKVTGRKTVKAGRSIQLKASQKKVKWSICKKAKKYASINQKGVFKAKKKGKGKKVQVICRDKNNQVCKLTVKIK